MSEVEGQGTVVSSVGLLFVTACGEAKQDSGQDVRWKKTGLNELASTEPGTEMEETLS